MRASPAAAQFLDGSHTRECLACRRASAAVQFDNMPQYEGIDQSGWARTCGECGGPLTWAWHRVHESDDGQRRTAEFRAVCVAECAAYRSTKSTGREPEHVDVPESWAPNPTHSR
jgi:hypothetical protein